MQMSDSCRNSRGFTLLELLVVMGLMSLVTAVAMPGLVSLYDAIARNIALEGIAVDINQLGRRTYESGVPVTLSSTAIDLPEGWSLKTPKPIVYSAKGVCQGGTLMLIYDGELVRKAKLNPPYCHVGDDA